MMHYRKLEHRFVDHFPDALEGGVLYVSISFGSAAHSCCCGCGEEIVTPLTPTDWRITFDGETISLSPSVGSWTLRCRSHYVIDRGRVIEALPWSEKEIEAERRRDLRAKQQYYGQMSPTQSAVSPPSNGQWIEAPLEAPTGAWNSFVRAVYSKFSFWRNE